jgi:selenocysteine lyase/cysteine desulfurase
MSALAAHVRGLTADLLAALLRARHPSGAPLVRLYGPRTAVDRGGIVSFNVLDRAGRTVPHALVEDRARAMGVAVRGGCFCNPGASEAAFGVDPARAAACLAQLGDSFSEGALSRCLGVPLGAVRVSMGLANDAKDVRRAVDVVTSFGEEPRASPYPRRHG